MKPLASGLPHASQRTGKVEWSETTTRSMASARKQRRFWLSSQTANSSCERRRSSRTPKLPPFTLWSSASLRRRFQSRERKCWRSTRIVLAALSTSLATSACTPTSSKRAARGLFDAAIACSTATGLEAKEAPAAASAPATAKPFATIATLGPALTSCSSFRARKSARVRVIFARPADSALAAIFCDASRDFAGGRLPCSLTLPRSCSSTLARPRPKGPRAASSAWWRLASSRMKLGGTVAAGTGASAFVAAS
mmetsp:Transcript_119793/g.267433  ORF Transcript_119793/g.267433 Transcript_119793/m.267433 type:complete len:253 (+) Transcript_119793:38-796(+)